jgi:drug/metabolite transporter (DMT)-like permease
MQISVTELVTVLVIYTAMTGSGAYWLWHRAMRPARRVTWAAALFVMPVPALILMGVVRPGWPQR